MSQEDREDRDISIVAGGILTLLLGVIVCGVLSTFLLLLSILGITP